MLYKSTFGGNESKDFIPGACLTTILRAIIIYLVNEEKYTCVNGYGLSNISV